MFTGGLKSPCCRLMIRAGVMFALFCFVFVSFANGDETTETTTSVDNTELLENIYQSVTWLGYGVFMFFGAWFARMFWHG